MQPITPIYSNDYPEIVDVWEASVRATHSFLSEDDIQYFKPLILNEFLKSVDLFGIRDKNNRLTGFLGVLEDKIEMLFILPELRGRGIGGSLLNFALQEKGAKYVDVNEQNEQAVGFYSRMGFKVISRSPFDPLGKPFPILHMELK